jgi:hypothetical protein
MDTPHHHLSLCLLSFIQQQTGEPPTPGFTLQDELQVLEQIALVHTLAINTKIFKSSPWSNKQTQQTSIKIMNIGKQIWNCIELCNNEQQQTLTQWTNIVQKIQQLLLIDQLQKSIDLKHALREAQMMKCTLCLNQRINLAMACEETRKLVLEWKNQSQSVEERIWILRGNIVKEMSCYALALVHFTQPIIPRTMSDELIQPLQPLIKQDVENHFSIADGIKDDNGNNTFIFDIKNANILFDEGYFASAERIYAGCLLLVIGKTNTNLVMIVKLLVQIAKCLRLRNVHLDSAVACCCAAARMLTLLNSGDEKTTTLQIQVLFERAQILFDEGKYHSALRDGEMIIKSSTKSLLLSNTTNPTLNDVNIFMKRVKDASQVSHDIIPSIFWQSTMKRHVSIHILSSSDDNNNTRKNDAERKITLGILIGNITDVEIPPEYLSTTQKELFNSSSINIQIEIIPIIKETSNNTILKHQVIVDVQLPTRLKFLLPLQDDVLLWEELPLLTWKHILCTANTLVYGPSQQQQQQQQHQQQQHQQQQVPSQDDLFDLSSIIVTRDFSGERRWVVERQQQCNNNQQLPTYKGKWNTSRLTKPESLRDIDIPCLAPRIDN